MKELEGPALADLDAIIGTSGAGSQTTEVPDGVMGLELDVGKIIRRARAPRSGMFVYRLINAHGGAGTLVGQVDVYRLAVATTLTPWPSPVPDGLDAWVLGGYLVTDTAASFTSGWLGIRGNDIVPITGGGALDIPYLATIGQISVGGTEFGNPQGAAGNIGMPLARWGAVRVPRCEPGQFNLTLVTIAGVASNISANLMMGLFPKGLEQDAVG